MNLFFVLLSFNLLFVYIIETRLLMASFFLCWQSIFYGDNSFFFLMGAIRLNVNGKKAQMIVY